MGLWGADPGGEPWFNRTMAQMLAEGILGDANGISNDNAAPAGRATTYGYKSTGGVVWAAKSFANSGTVTVGWANYNSSALWASNEIFTLTEWVYAWCRTIRQCNRQPALQAQRHAHWKCKHKRAYNGLALFRDFGSRDHGRDRTVTVKVDGVTWITITSVITSGTANAFANRFYIQPIVQNTNQWYKDIYWRSDSTFMGDLTVNVCYASAAGPSQQFAPTGGTQVSCVQDGITHTGTWPDDTSYIFDSTSGHISDFNPQNITLPGGGSIKGVVHVSRLSTDVGGGTAQQYSKSGSTVHTTSTITLGTSPFYFFDVMENDPNTGSAWTQSGFNAATHGVKVP